MTSSDHHHHHHGFVFYHYSPSLAAAILFAVLFTLSTLFHIFQIWRHKTWFFIALMIGGIFELVGYIGRAISSQNQNTLGPFVIQSVLLLVAPALFAASIYMILGRLIRAVQGEKCAVVPVKWLTRTFVGGDIIAFLMQASGGGLQASGSPSTIDAGKDMVLGGLFVQLSWFGFFVVAAAIFQYRFSRREHYVGELRWKRHMFALYASSALILIRSVYRVVEYLEGYNGYIFHHEVFVYVLDGTLMLGVMVIFNIIHFPVRSSDLPLQPSKA